MTKVAVHRERWPGEHRVALVPDVVPRLTGAGCEVFIEAGAGEAAHFPDELYIGRGCHIATGLNELLEGADAVLTVEPPVEDELHRLPERSSLIGMLGGGSDHELLAALARRRITAFSLELVPRIGRAQEMDALSSQATVAGYQAALLAATRLPRFFPMLVTAAGTIPPARVLVLGAGVAGLQAIATSRRLGAAVSAYDVRTATKEEVESLGAHFVELDLEAEEGSGGYATEQSEGFVTEQHRLLAEHVGAADAVITTAAVPGRPAPVLVTTEMVEAMRPGSVVLDLAADSGGNCELSVSGKEVLHGGVVVYGAHGLPSDVATHASQLYARNVSALLLSMVRDGAWSPDFEDEVLAATCVTRDGAVVGEPTASPAIEPRVRGIDDPTVKYGRDLSAHVRRGGREA
jgi:NAD(P) transhydrogenase subunit alpha